MTKQLSHRLHATQDGGLMFWCPGCQTPHLVRTGNGGGGGVRWRWNGSVDAPTFSPSVLVMTGRAVQPDFVPEPGDPPEICHSFVTDGQIQFLGDCTHDLAGQTVPLPAWEDQE